MIVKVGGTEVDIRVEAVLSMPRLSFTANHFAWAQALMPLGIRPTMGTGAFWSQVNSRIFEQFIDKAEYLLAIDYDTFFTKEDVEQLFAMAMTFQADAITGLQTKREDGRPMLTLKGTLDNPPDEGSTKLPMSWFAEPVQEVDSAHFGCTVISTAALRRMKKPWFWSKPKVTVTRFDIAWKLGIRYFSVNCCESRKLSTRYQSHRPLFWMRAVWVPVFWRWHKS